MLLLATAIFLMVLHLSRGYYARLHWSPHSVAALSPRTLQLLDTLSEDVRLHVLMRRDNDLRPAIAKLLREYAANGNVSVESVDPDRDLASAEQLVRQFQLDGGECLVVEIGNRYRAIPIDELTETPSDREAADPGPVLFRGEQVLSSALFALTQTVRPTVHFIQGHGERSPLDFDRRNGYSRIAARMRDDNLDVEVLNLGAARTIPQDCALMVIAGPTRELAPFELALIRDYLDRKGRLLLLLDARASTGLEPLLRNWGVQLGDDVVIDPEQTLGGRDLYLTTYPDHPVTTPLQGLATVFYLPRSIRPLPGSMGGDKPTVHPLAVSSAAGWAEFAPDDAAPRFDPQVDVPGPVPIAVAIERGPVPGVHVQILPTRLAVVGDSAFASNGGLTGANADFFLNTVNWLLEREDLLAIAPRPLDELRLAMNRTQAQRLFILAVVAPPALVALAGLILLWRRRRTL